MNEVEQKSKRGFQKGHGLLGKNPTSSGKHWKLSDDTKKKMSLSAMGNKKCLGKKNGLGFKHTNEAKKKIGSACTGNKHYNWKGGISKIDKLCRNMAEYKQWRSDIFMRDNWKCRTCGFTGYVTAHHINGFSKIIKEEKIKSVADARNCLLLWDFNNGVTLCEECHKLTDNYAGRKPKK